MYITQNGVRTTGPRQSGPSFDVAAAATRMVEWPLNGKTFFLIRYDDVMNVCDVIDFEGGCEICADNII